MMGMYDSVYAECPRCGHRCEFQTKDGACMMESYTLESAPTYLLLDIINEPHWCAGCQSWFALVDPAIPPGPPPRPNVTAVPVRDPVEGEFSVYEHRPEILRWWDAPFTFDDLAQGIEAGTAETRSGSVHESPVGAADAPETPPENHHGQ